MNLPYTRAMVRAAIRGELNDVTTVKDEIFGLEIPTHITDVPDDVLIPRNTWENKDAYDQTAKELAVKFHENFKKFSHVSDEITNAGPLYRAK